MVGIALVVTAGIDAQRTGARVEAHAEFTATPKERARGARDESYPDFLFVFLEVGGGVTPSAEPTHRERRRRGPEA
jgi:hypothetical protein